MAASIAGVAQIDTLSISSAFQTPIHQPDAAPSISRIAEAALDGIRTLQLDLDGGLGAATRPEPSVQSMPRVGAGEGVPEGLMAEHAQILADQIAASTQVQAQLVRFVMASSMSSSLGRNLNMFLRGQ